MPWRCARGRRATRKHFARNRRTGQAMTSGAPRLFALFQEKGPAIRCSDQPSPPARPKSPIVRGSSVEGSEVANEEMATDSLLSRLSFSRFVAIPADDLCLAYAELWAHS